MPAKKTAKSNARSSKSPRTTKSSKAVVVNGRNTSNPFSRKTLMAFVAAFVFVGALTVFITRAATAQGAISSAVSTNKCLDNSGNRKANSNKIQTYTCNNTDAQKWTVKDDGTILNANGYCLDVRGAGKTPKTLVQLYTCNNTPAQKWAVKSNGSIVNPNSGLCLDVKYAGTANGTQIWIWPCNGTVAQKWTLPKAAPMPNPPAPKPTPAPAPAPGPKPTPTPAPSQPSSTVTLFTASKKEIAMQLVSSAENSSLNWKAQYGYIEDIGDGRGYTAGIIGFCSGTSDMLALVQYYDKIAPNNVLSKYIPALKKVNGTASHEGLGNAFVSAWKTAAKDAKFQEAQNHERDRAYFNPAVNQAIADGVHTLGQFIYYDAMVMHGPGSDAESFGGIRAAALKKAKTPAQGGNETTYLHAFLDARRAAMKMEAAHEDTTRVDTAQRVFLNAGNLDLNVPLNWKVYGDPFSITKNP